MVSASAASVEPAAPSAEARLPARRIAATLAAMAETTERAGAGAPLAVRFAVSSSRAGIVERMVLHVAVFFSTTSADVPVVFFPAAPANVPVIFLSAFSADISVVLFSATPTDVLIVSVVVHVIGHSALTTISVIVVAIVKSIAVRDIRVVVIHDGVAAPVSSPIVPSPSIAAVKTHVKSDPP